eukprot:XP_028337183.1 uncharacterized protein LOC114484529 isoform X2 [Physeter catodon]
MGPPSSQTRVGPKAALPSTFPLTLETQALTWQVCPPPRTTMTKSIRRRAPSVKHAPSRNASHVCTGRKGTFRCPTPNGPQCPRQYNGELAETEQRRADHPRLHTVTGGSHRVGAEQRPGHKRELTAWFHLIKEASSHRPWPTRRPQPKEPTSLSRAQVPAQDLLDKIHGSSQPGPVTGSSGLENPSPARGLHLEVQHASPS